MTQSLHKQAWYLALTLLSLGIANAQSPTGTAGSAKNQPHEVWNDPSTSLTWAAKDNGKDVSWKGAAKYCHALRLGGYTDWRLANMFELQGIYDLSANASGRAGDTKGGVPRDFTWHVKGNLFLTGDEWSGWVDPKQKSSGYEYYFDFNDGKSDKDPVGWPYPYNGRRALCVRGSGDPLGGQRQHSQSNPQLTGLQ